MSGKTAMTNGEQLKKHFPDQFDRICVLVAEEHKPGWLNKDTDLRSPAGTLAAAFMWADTNEGHDYWQALHDKAQAA
jgi:hypothetical protein